MTLLFKVLTEDGKPAHGGAGGDRVSAIALSPAGGEATVTFDRWDLATYGVFLRAKQLPEKRLSYDLRSGRYQLTTPARFAHLLDESLALAPRAISAPGEHLFDYQRFITERALEARRYAIWADTGLGKTAMFLDWTRRVRDLTGGRVLILSPLGIIEQTRDEARRFYGEELAVERLATRADLAAFCRGAGPAVAIINPEKLIGFVS